MALENSKSIGCIHNKIKREINELPHNNELTLQYCNQNRFWGVLIVDGKYVAVKGYERKIPFIWGIDYITHDIPICVLAPSENFLAMKNFFTKLKNTGYKLRGIVCDDNESIKMAAEYVYPKTFIQTCQFHALENIRSSLGVRSNDTYRSFVKDIEKKIFSIDFLGKKKTRKYLFELLEKHKDDPVKISTLQYVCDHAEELSNYNKIGGCPKTTNLIESYNKHLNGRLKTIQGFESFQNAERWLSAYTIYRRLKPFTDCKGRFKKLNGKCSLQMTKRRQLNLPDFF